MEYAIQFAVFKAHKLPSHPDKVEWADYLHYASPEFAEKHLVSIVESFEHATNVISIAIVESTIISVKMDDGYIHLYRIAETGEVH